DVNPRIEKWTQPETQSSQEIYDEYIPNHTLIYCIMPYPMYTVYLSWHWEGIVELDQLWKPKCLRLGWCINFPPHRLNRESGRDYIETVLEFHIGKPKTPSKHILRGGAFRTLCPVRWAMAAPQGRPSLRGCPLGGVQTYTPLTLRLNYLENLDPIEHGVRTLPLVVCVCVYSDIYISLKIQSIYYTISRSNQWNTGIRPGPGRSAVPRLRQERLRASMRTHRITQVRNNMTCMYKMHLSFLPSTFFCSFLSSQRSQDHT
uniref:Uncharacterized protein n=1 Tax=Oncorhynchus tshawytscha TaxID=74940 RepID=A0A8C8CSY7_ONCTS